MGVVSGADSSVGNLIFLSYRRKDTLAQTLALKLELERRLSAVQVFMDYRAIEPGDVFANQIDSALRVAKVVLIVIGKNWAGDVIDGKSRIAQEDDWVRREVWFALLEKSDCVVPILMDGAEFPPTHILPDNLKNLGNLQSLNIQMTELESQLQTLLKILDVKFNLKTKISNYSLPIPDPLISKTIPYPWDELEKAITRELKFWSIEFSEDPEKLNYKRVELRRDFIFKNYKSAIEFVKLIAIDSTNFNHHPRFHVVWKTVTVWMSTWDAGHRITVLDVQMARALEQKFQNFTQSKKANE